LTDPHTWAGGQNGWELYTQVYDRLIQLTPDSKGLAPMLATAWKWNSANTVLTLTLRKDVMFQDGTPFNADVAVQNLKAGSGKGSNGATSLALMTSVVAVDPTTVKLTFSQPDPDAIFALAYWPGTMVSLNGLAHPDQLALHPMGSGPYKLVDVSAALTFTFDRFDGYWNKSHVYPAHYVEPAIANETSRLNAVKTGVADFAPISALTYQVALADKSLQVATYPNLEQYAVFMNNTVAPFDNPQVREAVNLALDRPAINASLTGLCTPVSQAFPPDMDGFVPSLTTNTDVTKAKQLIQAAGATGAKVKLLSIASFQPNATLAQEVQAQLNAVGLSVQIAAQPPGATFRLLYQQGGYGMLLAPPAITSADPSQILDMYVLGVGNPGTKDPALVTKIQQAEQLAIGSSQRTAAMQAINKDLSDPNNMLWASICQGRNLFVGTNKVIGLQTNFPNALLSQAATNSYIQKAK
jgi:ABC-type transport system substrate-binding protein